MNLAEYAAHDGLGLAELVRQGTISSRELAELALAAIDTTHARLNAVIERFPKRVPAVRAAPDRSAPFCGVPFLIKDFPIERNTLAEMGSALAAGYRPECDSELMVRLRRAGVVTLGRTTTSEFGLMALTVCEHTGITRNPWDTLRSIDPGPFLPPWISRTSQS